RIGTTTTATTNTGTTLVTPPTQIASVPPADTGASSPIGRLVSGASAGAGTVVAEEPPPNEPKKVRTVTVTRDGAIISNAVEPSPAPPPSPAPIVTTPAPAPVV